MSYGGRGNYGRRQPKPLPTEPPYKAYVGNLPSHVVEGDFDTIFDQMKVKHTRMIHDKETGKFKGFAYVEFENVDDLRAAIAMDGRQIEDGKSIRIDVAEDRPRGGDRGGRGGRGGGPGGMHRGGHGGGQGGDRFPPRGDRGPPRGGQWSGGRDQDGGGWSSGGGRDQYSDNRRGSQNDYDRPRANHSPTNDPPASSSGRPKLNLKKRTVQAAVGGYSDNTKSRNENIFGAARPREDVLKEKKLDDPSEKVAEKIEKQMAGIDLAPEE